MKGTPDTPQCGFSRAGIQILGLEGVDPEKFTAFNVLEDEELRQGKLFTMLLSRLGGLTGDALYGVAWGRRVGSEVRAGMRLKGVPGG